MPAALVPPTRCRAKYSAEENKEQKKDARGREKRRAIKWQMSVGQTPGQSYRCQQPTLCTCSGDGLQSPVAINGEQIIVQKNQGRFVSIGRSSLRPAIVGSHGQKSRRVPDTGVFCLDSWSTWTKETTQDNRSILFFSFRLWTFLAWISRILLATVSSFFRSPCFIQSTLDLIIVMQIRACSRSDTESTENIIFTRSAMAESLFLLLKKISSPGSAILGQNTFCRSSTRTLC